MTSPLAVEEPPAPVNDPSAPMTMEPPELAAGAALVLDAPALDGLTLDALALALPLDALLQPAAASAAAATMAAAAARLYLRDSDFFIIRPLLSQNQ